LVVTIVAEQGITDGPRLKRALKSNEALTSNDGSKIMRNFEMKAILLGAAAVLAPMTLAAQVPGQVQSGAQQQVPTSAATLTASPNGNTMDSSLNGGSGVDTQLVQDKMFVRKAQELSFAEIKFGQLAAQKAGNDDVKKFGQKCADEHPLDAALKPAADELGLRPATKLGKGDQVELRS